MLLLKLLTLLKDEKVSTKDMTEIIERTKTEHEFDEAIKPYIRSTPEEFRDRWASCGFSSTKVSIWENILKNYYNSNIEYSLQKLVEVKHSDLANNVDGLDVIFKEVAEDLSSSSFTFGNSIPKSISNSVSRAFSNNKQKYRTMFRVRQNDPNINPAVLEIEDTPTKSITDGMKALRNVPSSEVKALLSDIYGTRYMYRFDTVTSTHFCYTMYESFLRAYFKHEMAEFNKGPVKVNLYEHVESKYRKLDELMEAILVDFILSGIYDNNLTDFQNLVFHASEENTINNTVAIFGQKDLKLPGEEGNFNNGRTFASKGLAKEKYDKLIKGFIALSKLYQYLRDAGFSPYCIHPDLFHFEFEDPSDKFMSLDEVVKFSTEYVKTRRKYNLTGSPFDFKALVSNTNGALLLPRNYDDVILANRNKIVLENLSNSVTNLTSDNADQCYATVHLPHLEMKASIFDLADFLSKDINPLYAIFKGDHHEWDNDDTEEVWDKEVMHDYFSYLLECDALGFTEYEMERETFLRMVDSSQGEIRDLFDDLVDCELDTQIKILLALRDFVREFKKVIESFEQKYTKGVIDVSEIEYSTFLHNHKLFAPLHDLVDASVYRSSGDGLVTKVILALLRKYYPDLSMEELSSFLTRTCKNISYGNFIDSIQARTFKDITTYFHYAKANLYNLSDSGKPVCLNKADLEYALINADPVLNMDRFIEAVKGVRQNELGYLVNSMGDLYKVITRDNKTAALHSSGLYIFNDRTTKPWS